MYGQGGGRGRGGWGNQPFGRGGGRGRGSWGQQVQNPPGTGKRFRARQTNAGAGFGGGWNTPKPAWQGGGNNWQAQGQAAARAQLQRSQAKLEGKAEKSERGYSKAKESVAELKAQHKMGQRVAASTAQAVGLLQGSDQAKIDALQKSLAKSSKKSLREELF